MKSDILPYNLNGLCLLAVDLAKNTLRSSGGFGREKRALVVSTELITPNQYEDKCQFERSAAIAVWCEQLDKAVSALQRASDHFKRSVVESEDVRLCEKLNYYASTLDIVAMNIQE